MKTAKDILNKIEKSEASRGNKKASDARVANIMGTSANNIWSYRTGRRRMTNRTRAHLLTLLIYSKAGKLNELEMEISKDREANGS